MCMQVQYLKLSKVKSKLVKLFMSFVFVLFSSQQLGRNLYVHFSHLLTQQTTVNHWMQIKHQKKMLLATHEYCIYV